MQYEMYWEDRTQPFACVKIWAWMGRQWKRIQSCCGPIESFEKWTGEIQSEAKVNIFNLVRCVSSCCPDSLQVAHNHQPASSWHLHLGPGRTYFRPGLSIPVILASVLVFQPMRRKFEVAIPRFACDAGLCVCPADSFGQPVRVGCLACLTFCFA